MKVAVVTANLGNFDNQIDPVPQTEKYDFYRFTDQNFPPRYCTMTPRLQARIVKCFMWQMVPGYSHYIWVDSSCTLGHSDSVKWFLEKCKDVEMVVFKHPNRNTIQEEADYLKQRLAKGCPYITPRYDNELIDEQLKEINSDPSFKDQILFASTAFVMVNNHHTRTIMAKWWYHISRYHSIDQLSLPYVLMTNACLVRIIPDSYMKIPYLTYIRRRG